MLYYRSTIISLLESIARLDVDEGPTELRCLWFDDFYLPAQSDEANYSPGVWEKGICEWKKCFSLPELEIFEEFNVVFTQESHGLSTAWPDWQTDSKWLVIRDAARLALLKINNL